jgi:hypothetical protein
LPSVFLLFILKIKQLIKMFYNAHHIDRHYNFRYKKQKQDYIRK